MIFRVLYIVLTAGVSICIDPGHGGSSSGAVGEYILEKDVVLQVGLEIQNWLCQVPGITRVSLTRDGDYDVSLQARTGYANANGFDRLISVHENAFDGSVQGTETFAASLSPGDESFLLAALVQDRILDAYGYNDRGVKDGSYLHMIRESSMPAILGEGSFLDYTLNWNESWLYAFNVDDHTGVQAWGYADAVCSHFGFDTPEYGNGVVLMDNLFPGFSVNDSLEWNEQVSGAPWMADCMTGVSSSSLWANWESVVPFYGVRTVQMWWTSGSDRSMSVMCRIHHQGGMDDVFIDQTSAGEQWYTLGTWSFSEQCVVELLGEGSSSGVVCADAVRLVYPAGTDPVPDGTFRVTVNPASSFTLILPGESETDIRIFDLSGRVVDVLHGSGSVGWIPEDVNPGVFFAVEEETGQVVKLMVLN